MMEDQGLNINAKNFQFFFKDFFRNSNDFYNDRSGFLLRKVKILS